MTVNELKEKLNNMPGNCEVLTHIKIKNNKYIVIPVKDIVLDVSGVVAVEGVSFK